MIGRLVLVAALLGLSAAGELALKERRPKGPPMLQQSAFAALGGLRSVAAEVVWFRADRLQEEGRYVELAQLARTLTYMEPHTPEVWSYASWNLAYNVSVMMTTPEDRWRWVLSALSLLRDDGIRYNPASPELHRELAWLFELKIGADIDTAAPVYRAKWREIVEDVAKRGAWSELGMDPSRMAEIESRYGLRDRANPQYSAIYWAHCGLPHATGKNQSILQEIVRQARIIYMRGIAKPRTNG